MEEREKEEKASGSILNKRRRKEGSGVLLGEGGKESLDDDKRRFDPRVSVILDEGRGCWRTGVITIGMDERMGRRSWIFFFFFYVKKYKYSLDKGVAKIL